MTRQSRTSRAWKLEEEAREAVFELQTPTMSGTERIALVLGVLGPVAKLRRMASERPWNGGSFIAGIGIGWLAYAVGVIVATHFL